MDSPSFPNLPEDIARHILELAAFCDKSTARRLLLVSKKVHRWTRPLLYRVVEIASDSWGSHVLIRKITHDTADTGFIAKNVKVLCLRAHKVTSVLPNCTAVQNLAIVGDTPDKVPCECIHASKELRYLALLTPNVLDATLMPLKVSHLEILYPTDENIPNVQNILRTRPNLTHLLITVNKWNDFPEPRNIGQEPQTSKATGMLKKLLSAAQDSLQALILNRGRDLTGNVPEQSFPEDTTAEMRKAFATFFAAVGDPRFVVLFRDFPLPDIPGVGRYENGRGPWPWFKTHCDMWDEVDRVQRRLLQTDSTPESSRR